MKMTLTELFQVCQGSTSRDRKNQRSIILWSLLWMTAWVLLVLAIKKEWVTGAWPVGLATAATLPLAILFILAYRRFLREADELRRKIELEALALAFGVGLVGGFSFYALGRAGVLEMRDFLYVIVAMVLTHSVAIVVGHWRYS